MAYRIEIAVAAALFGLTALPGATAAADCAAGIEAIKERLELHERPTDAGPILNKGKAIEEDGGTTVYAETGPATPRENWFGDSPGKAAALVKLEEAIAARESGDTEACTARIEEARLILEE